MVDEVVSLFREPYRGRRPVMLAAWPGVGQVALIVARYLQQKLGAEPIGELESFHFFEPTGVAVKDNVVQEPQFPSNTLYYWKNPADARSDLLLFLGEAQPASQAYELAHCIVDVAQKFKARKVVTCAAALVRMHYTEPSKVWGVATEPRLLDEFKGLDVVMRGELQIAGMNGVLLGVAKERKVEGYCLLGEVPMYATRIPNPKAALAVAGVLKKVLNVDVGLEELGTQAKEAEEEMKHLAVQAMGEFIDHFTKPIWPPPSEEGPEEDEA
ncbi:MAG: PAC2 family protein [Chloroflexi bacterium]|nr:PAC2 family protein [Chloroflexota bacterium]